MSLPNVSTVDSFDICDSNSRIYASGASGGAGYQNFVNSKADQIRALIKLSKGEQLFILVGQMGVSGCKTCKNIKVS